MDILTDAERCIRDLIQSLGGYLPDKNCSCHLAPPCGDCVDYGHDRGVFEDAKQTIAKLQIARGVLPIQR